MIDPGQFRREIIAPTLNALDMNSQAAEDLLLGTALVESRLTFLVQHGGGPARGFYQMEPATARDLTVRYFQRRTDLEARLEAAVYLLERVDVNWPEVSDEDLAQRLISDLRLATALARLRYWMVEAPLPEADDVEGYAAYWKLHYNTPGGLGREIEFVRLYRMWGED